MQAQALWKCAIDFKNNGIKMNKYGWLVQIPSPGEMGTLQGLKENSGSRALCVAVGAGATAEQLQVEVQPSGTKVWIAAHSFEADHDEISKMSIFDACAKSRWTVLLGRLVSAFKMVRYKSLPHAPVQHPSPSLSCLPRCFFISLA